MGDKKIGQIIKELRQREGLKSKELAKKAGIKSSNLSIIENNQHEPRISTLNAILNALKLPTVEELITAHDKIARFKEYVDLLFRK